MRGSGQNLSHPLELECHFNWSDNKLLIHVHYVYYRMHEKEVAAASFQDADPPFAPGFRKMVNLPDPQWVGRALHIQIGTPGGLRGR